MHLNLSFICLASTGLVSEFENDWKAHLFLWYNCNQHITTKEWFFLGQSGIVGVSFFFFTDGHWVNEGSKKWLQCLLKTIWTCFLVRSTQRTTLSQLKQRRATQVEALGVTQATWNLRMETVSNALSVSCKPLIQFPSVLACTGWSTQLIKKSICNRMFSCYSDTTLFPQGLSLQVEREQTILASLTLPLVSLNGLHRLFCKGFVHLLSL